MVFVSDVNYPKQGVTDIGFDISNIKSKKINHTNLNEALLEAIYNDNLKIVKILVEAGADINYCGKDSYSHPLLRAAYYGYADITEYLLELLIVRRKKHF